MNLQKWGVHGWYPWSSHIDANPEQEEEDSEAHEEPDQQGGEEIFVDVPRVLGGGDLIDEEPGSEEHADGQ